jgi:hypothetical protein
MPGIEGRRSLRRRCLLVVVACLATCPTVSAGDDRKKDKSASPGADGADDASGAADVLAHSSTVTSSTGPLPGTRFGRHADPSTILREKSAIRQIQAEMSANAGRDELLQKEGWRDLEATVERVKSYLASNKPEAGTLASLASEQINSSMQRLVRRYSELKNLRTKVLERLRSPFYAEYVEALEQRLDRGKMPAPHDMSEVSRAHAVWTLIRIVKGGGVGPVTAPVTVISLIAKTKEGMTLHYENLIIRDRTPGFLDLSEMANDLQILLEQYELRIRMQGKATGEMWPQAQPRVFRP